MKRANSTTKLIDALLAAVGAKFGSDSPSPGIVMARLPSGRIYASVRRYNGWSDVKGGGIRLCNSNGKNADEAVRDLAKKFHASHAPPDTKNAFDALGEVLS